MLPLVARKPSKRVVMNREALDAIRLGMADGTHNVGMAIIEGAQVPDAPPYGVGLVDTGRVVTLVDGRKVAGEGTPPREAKVGKGTVTIFGFGFPGRFQELGTSKQPARPFLTPSVQEQIPSAGAECAAATAVRLRGVR
jgi:hypothetical protein